jgi:uncharacterized protein YodC (DUF2158 family)
MADVFKPGDTVQLKSGGPVMTVEQVDEKTGVRCQWFYGDKMNRSWFKPETLTKTGQRTKA